MTLAGLALHRSFRLLCPHLDFIKFLGVARGSQPLFGDILGRSLRVQRRSFRQKGTVVFCWRSLCPSMANLLFLMVWIFVR